MQTAPTLETAITDIGIKRAMNRIKLRESSASYVRTYFGTDKQLEQRALRVHHEKLRALMVERNEIIGEAVGRRINVTMLFQHALQDLEQRKVAR